MPSDEKPPGTQPDSAPSIGNNVPSPGRKRRVGVTRDESGISVRAGTTFSEIMNQLAAGYPSITQAAAASFADSFDVGVRSRPPAALERQVSDLQSEIARLRAEVTEKAQALEQHEIKAAYKDGFIAAMTEQFTELSRKQALAHLLDRVSHEAQTKLFESSELRDAFQREDASSAYVMSIDIRRSTDLMLKARTARLFAQFIVTLAQGLREIVIAHHGVFDKFTGDGILAFFPEFFTGPDAGYFALRAATQAHQLFTTHYDSHRHCFAAILRDTGLGIGIDYGAVNIVHLGSDFTVVGTPVVYACRMGGATAGQTYLNQAAYEQIAERYSAIADVQATEIDVKNEGLMLAYTTILNGKPFEPAKPGWANLPQAG